MTVNNFIRKLLNLKELTVTGFDFTQRQKCLVLYVKPYKNGCRCPHCNRRGRIKSQLDTCRIWQEFPLA